MRMLKILHRPFMFFRRFPRGKRSQILASPGLGIHFSRIQSILSVLQFSDHKCLKGNSRSTTMNDLEFRRHLKDLAHGHHHPDEHDWAPQPAARKSASVQSGKPAHRRTAKKPAAHK
jgi:hypothetical protein